MKIFRKFAGILLTAFFVFGLGGALISGRITEAEADETVAVVLDTSKFTCDFTSFEDYADTHRTRIVIEPGGAEIGSYYINTEEALPSCITINGKTLAEYSAEYAALLEAGTAPGITSQEVAIKMSLNNGNATYAPIAVKLTWQETIGNMLDIYIPESYISASDVREVGILSGFTCNGTSDTTRYNVYSIKQSVTFVNPNAATQPAVYKVTVDGEAQEVAEGECAVEPAISPTKAEDDDYVYTFAGWVNADTGASFDFSTPVTGDLTIVAKFTQTEKHTVMIDGASQTVLDGQLAVKPETDPTKAEDENGVYAFDCWVLEGTETEYDFSIPVTGDLTIVAKFTQTEKHTVMIDGASQIVLDGRLAIKPENDPTKAEDETYVYAFECWVLEGTETEYDFSTPVTSDLVIVAKFTQTEKHTVTIEGVSQTVLDGQLAVKPEVDPTKAEDENGVYAFDCWVLDGTETEYDFSTPVTSDLVIVAKFTQTEKHTVTIEGVSQIVLDGQLAVKPENDPTKAEDENYVYTFVGWMNADTGTLFDFSTPIKDDLTLVAKFEETAKYTVMVGEETYIILEGGYVTEPKLDPIKAEDETYVYAFECWVLEGAETEYDFSMPVTSDLVIVAKFTQTEKHTVTIDGVSQIVLDGQLAVKPEVDPTKAEDENYVYTFIGWMNADTGALFDFSKPITDDLTLVAKFNETAKYAVTIDGIVQIVLSGSKLEGPAETPAREETESHVYAFVGWYYSVNGAEVYWDFEKDTVQSELVLTAGFTAIEKKKFTVTFDPDNGSAAFGVQVYDGSYVKPEQVPEDPLKATANNVEYTFYCWSADGETAWAFDRNPIVTEDITLKAYYATRLVYTVWFDGVPKVYEAGSYLEEPDDPVKAATEEYEYDFVGWYYLKDEILTLWDFSADTVWSDLFLVSEFETRKTQFEIAVYPDGLDGRGQIFYVAWGEAVRYPTVGEKEGYEFLGWVDGSGNAAPSVMPKENFSVFGNWQTVEYVATVVGTDGVKHEEIYTIETAEAVLEILKDYPIVASSEKYTYSWLDTLPDELPLSDCSFRMQATKLRYKLTITVDFESLTSVEERVLTWGDEILLDEPVAGRGQEFLGWITDEGSAVPTNMPTKNLSVRADWKWSEYTMTIVQVDGAENELVYTVKEADDALYVRALFASYPLPVNTKEYTYAWASALPEKLPLESGRVYAMTKTAVEYAVTFAGVSGVAPIVFTVETMRDIVFPNVPQRIGYTAAWDKTFADITLDNITVTAIYTPIEYTIKFVNADGVSPIVFTVETMLAVRLPAVPERRGYAGEWDKELSDIGLRDTTITAIYTPLEYTIVFANAEGVAPVSFTIETLSDLRFPAVPEKTGYAGGWNKELKEIGLANTTLTAVYTPLEYTVTFKGVEGVAPIVFTVESLKELTFPLIPERTGYLGKWDREPAEIGLENVTVEAVYVPIEYTIVFDVEGVAPLAFTVETFETLSLPEVPKKSGYVGKWDKTLAEIGLSNALLKAVYTPIEYVITFVCDDSTQELGFNAESLSSLCFPTIPEKVGYTAEWNKSVGELGLENTTVTAIYTPIVYMLTFANAADVAPVSFTVETLESLSFPAVPEKAGYVGKWDKKEEEIGLNNTVVAAVYTAVEYTLVFDAEGVKPMKFTVETRSKLRFPAVPSRIGYTAAWDKTPEELGLESTVISAVYTPIEYTIAFENAGELEPIVYTVETMDEVRLPLVPEKVGYTGEWNKTLAEIGLSNATLRAVYTAIEYTVAFENATGIEPIVFTVESLSDIIFPAVPEKRGYTGAWDKKEEALALENTTVAAVYTPIEYTLAFESAEEIEPMTFTVESLPDLKLPSVPERTGYTATWNKTVSEIGLEDTVISAVYTPIEYTLTFEGAEGIAPVVFTVETLSKLVLPVVPEKEGYTGRWDKAAEDIRAENTIITAIYTEIPAETPSVDDSSSAESVEDDSSESAEEGESSERSDEESSASERPVIDQIKDYGRDVASGCSGSVGAGAALIGAIVLIGAAFVYKKKEN